MLTVVDGSVELKDQLWDYKYRGEELGYMNFLNFMLDTYEGSKRDQDEDNGTEETPPMRDPSCEDLGDLPASEFPMKTKQAKASVAESNGYKGMRHFQES